MMYSRNTRLRRDFPRPPGERRLRCHLWKPSPSVAVNEWKNKRNLGQKNWGSPSAPHSYENFRRVMRIPNMCLVLWKVNWKVVSIANEQTESQTE